MDKIRWRCALTMVALFTTVFPLVGGTIVGRITITGSGQPVTGATVRVLDSKYGAVTDTNGHYAIENIPPGTYVLRIQSIGYASTEKSGVTVGRDDAPVEVDAVLAERPVSVAEVVVQARADRELETSGRLTEKSAENVVSVITAQTIEHSTDLTAADALQRVPGMSLTRSQGEGEFVVMRGLEARYNNTLVDGIKIPSPESKDRFVPLDIFPSALFERIEVNKAMTPELAGDAIGGSTNLMLRSAPDHFVLTVSGGEGGSESMLGTPFNTFDRSTVPLLDPQQVHGTVSSDDPLDQLKTRYIPKPSDFSSANMHFANEKGPLDGNYSALIGDRFFGSSLGLIAGGSYENTYDGIHTDFFSTDEEYNKRDKQGHEIPFLATVDSRNYFTNNTRDGVMAKLDFIPASEQEIDASCILVSKEEAQARHALQQVLAGSSGGAAFTYTNRSALRTQSISSFSLNGSHFTESRFSIHWTLNSTAANQDRPDEAEYTVLQSYDPGHHALSAPGQGDVTHTWRFNNDDQILGKIDFTFKMNDDGTQLLQAGGNAENLKRANFEDDYLLKPAIIKGRTPVFINIDSNKYNVFYYYSTIGTSVYGYQNYDASEQLRASYAQYAGTFGRLQMLAGVRWEQAHDLYLTEAPIKVGENSNDVKPADFLPGIHFRYQLTSEQIVRLSLTRTLSRPSYFDLVPAVDRSDNSETTGNPNLRPALSSNFDIRYEWYPNLSEEFSLGYYHKVITDPIIDQFNSIGVVLQTTKGNGPPATVDGIETVALKHFGDFGISGNATVVWSKEPGTSDAPYYDKNGLIYNMYFPTSHSLPEQSPFIGNLELLYNNASWGTSGNVSYNYTGKRLIALAQYDGLDTYEDGYGEVDVSAEQKLFSRLTINLKVKNLTDSESILEIPAGTYVLHDPLIVQKDLNKKRGFLGVVYRF